MSVSVAWSKWIRYFPTAAHWIGLAVVCLISAEMMSRLQDWIIYGESITSTHSMDNDLRQSFPDGTRGKPFASYRHCRLNSFGFRGPEFRKTPSPDKVRIAFLGASEIFGSCEIEGSEVPARVADVLQPRDSHEIINTAIAGMTLGSQHNYWRSWISQFEPAVGLVYVNPLFELNLPDRPPPSSSLADAKSRPTATYIPAFAPGLVRSRFVDALKNRFDFPEWIQEWRDERAVARVRSLQADGWEFDHLPQDRCDQFLDSLDRLTELIRGSGAEPVLMTHALAADSIDDPADLRVLRHGRTFCPRAPEQILLDYSDAVNDGIRKLAIRKGLLLIDVAREFDGRRELFVDLVHFNPRGEQLVAEYIAAFISNELAPGSLQARLAD